MDKQDIRTLQILEEIDREQAPSQRELAKKLNISLGLVNSFIKRLSHKGYFKVTTIPRNRISYMMTPKGFSEKTRLTYEYIQYSYRFYKDARQKLHSLFNTLSEAGVRRIVFYGTSDFAEIAYLSLQETKIELVEVVDDEKANKKFFNKTIKSPAVLNTASFDMILLTAIDSREQVMGRILKSGIPRNKVALIT